MPLLDLFRRARSGGPAELENFLHGQAAFVAQKTVSDYCPVKMGREDRRYFADADFKAALEHCRWQVFLAATADVIRLAEGVLRPLVGGRKAILGQGFLKMHGRVLMRDPCPTEEAGAAAEALAAFGHQLRVWQEAEAPPANRMELLSEPVLFATLPIHSDQRVGESLAIRGGLRFHVVSAQQEMERRFDLTALARSLSSAPAAIHVKNEVSYIRR